MGRTLTITFRSSSPSFEVPSDHAVTNSLARPMCSPASIRPTPFWSVRVFLSSVGLSSRSFQFGTNRSQPLLSASSHSVTTTMLLLTSLGDKVDDSLITMM